jgi:pilus assembly protein Flp/PilA
MLEPPFRTVGRCAAPKEERGATAVEYALLVSLVAAVVAATVTLLGTSVLGLFDSVLNQPPFN